MAAIAVGAMQQQQQNSPTNSVKESKRLSTTQEDSKMDSVTSDHQDATPVGANNSQQATYANSSDLNNNHNSAVNNNSDSKRKTKKAKVKEEKKKVKKIANSKKKDNGKAKKNGKKDQDDDHQEREEVQVPIRTAPSEGAPKTKTLVEELKLFQNNHLLNQQDPLQQLHIQLNALIQDDYATSKTSTPHTNIPPAQVAKPFASVTDAENRQLQYRANCLSDEMQQQQQFQSALANNQIYLAAAAAAGGGGNMIDPTIVDSFSEANENLSTVKKGVLWQQQNFEKFHQRLFSRWKKRYFILTTDYLVCFKRSSSKVGRSEMGKFLYKTSLSDVTKIEWLKPLKSDKGAIILHLNGPFNLFLWSKDNLEEWMFLLKESIERNKIRRSCMMQNGSKQQVVKDDFYSNIAILQEQHDYTNYNQQYKPQSDVHSKERQQTSLQPDSPRRLNGDRSEERGAIDKASEGEPLESKCNDRRQNQKPPLTGTDDGDKVSSVSVGSSASEKGRSMERSKAAAADKKPARRTEEHDQTGAQGSEMEAPEATINHLSNNDAARRESKSSRQSPLRAGGANSNGRDASTSSASSSTRSSSKRLGGGGRRDSSTPVVAASSAKRRDSSAKSGSNSNSNSAGSSKGSKRSQGKGKLRRDDDPSTADVSVVEGDLCNNSDASELGGKVKADVITDRLFHQQDRHNNRQQRAAPAEGTSGNLIRRDDSWQSLISLTRVGKVTPAAGGSNGEAGSFGSGSNDIISRRFAARQQQQQQKPSRQQPANGPLTPISVAQRSLYARHIMPDAVNESAGRTTDNLYNRQYMINIESSITPSRAAPFLRHQQSAVQTPLSSQRKLRPLAQHAASFDMVPGYPAASLTNQQPMGAHASYQQKLLQLQLLHNSNNVDYIRSSKGNQQQEADQQAIYGPDSASNYYGYSSMRSNLKSAASEFSFIRPSSSHTGQSTLPHPSSSFMLNNSNNSNAEQQAALRCSLIVPNTSSQQSDNNNNQIGSYLSPETNTQQQQQHVQLTNHLNSPDRRLMAMNQVPTGMHNLDPPMRELPLKPNKKRPTLNQHLVQDDHLPKSSSLTSSIAGFFRRAFSKRGKKGANRRQNKLAESCSSSLGPLDDSSHLPVMPSAFSTGSKSLVGGKSDGQQQAEPHRELIQPQRMVDMIEAFANKTLLNDKQNDHLAGGSPAPSRLNGPLSQRDSSSRISATDGQSQLVTGSPAVPQLRPRAAHFGGSPLHKSNSISATMGLSLADVNSRRSFLNESNELRAARQPGGSPLITRSSKVMSANLTPLLVKRSSVEQTESQQHSHFFLSPRNSRLEQSSRPSSIYGQPSMISSPVINGCRDNERNNNFGVHRNSLHNHHFQNQSSGFDIRRQQVMGRQPYLDSTKEVAEELSSPTTCEPRSLDFNLSPFQSSPSPAHRDQSVSRGPSKAAPFGRRGENLDKISASPSSGRLQQHSNHAVVNPILQSSTMDTIYDNHPMLNGFDSNPYSHYDNHNQLLAELQVHRQSPSMRSSKTSGSMSHYLPPEVADPYTSHRVLQQHQNRSSITPSRSRALNLDRSTVAEMVANQKPSAIVAPSTPDHNQNFNSPVIGRSGSNRNQATAQQTQRGSPLLSRRSAANQSHYQQSPLVSLDTRVINRDDGVQTTIIGGDRDSGGYRQVLQPVINIAGAPGINLEPSLAASLLRGTNINAYESATYDAIATDSSKSDSKTFLVSTRLSKSMAYGNAYG